MIKNIDVFMIEKIINEGVIRGAEFVELFIEEAKEISISIEEGVIQSPSICRNIGIGLRIFYHGRMAYLFSEGLDFETIRNNIIVTSKIVQRSEKSQILLPSPKTIYYPDHKDSHIPMDIEKTVSSLKNTYESSKNLSDKIEKIRMNYTGKQQNFIIANSRGLYIRHQRNILSFRASASARKHNKMQNGNVEIRSCGGDDVFEEFNPKTICIQACNKALVKEDTREIKSGITTAVICHGLLLHETVGHALESDFAYKGNSVFSDKIGNKVASENVTIVDNPLFSLGGGSIMIDDEGTQCKETVLIENGYLRSFLYDIQTAERMNTVSTGNGRRESYKYPPIPRMTNTILKEGDYGTEEIIHSVKNGIYIQRMSGGEYNISTGDFSCFINEGHAIENGHVTYPISGVSISGNCIKFLCNIDMVGSEFKVSSGDCCKLMQQINIGMIQPVFRVRGIGIGGKQ